MAHRGDLIACEVDFDNQGNSSIPILFSLNGKEVAHTLMEYTAGQTKLYPFISLGYEGIRVLAKVCKISYGFLFGRNLVGFCFETYARRDFDICPLNQPNKFLQLQNILARLLANFHCQ